MKDVFITYLLFEIEHQKDIRDGTFNDFDYRWKQGQIDLLKSIIDDLLGIQPQSTLESALAFIKEMEEDYEKQ